MTSNIEFTYNGKVYQSVPKSQRDGCKGCAFDLSDDGCTEATSDCSCTINKVIWKEKPADSTESSQQTEMTWTLDEIHQAYEDWDMYDGFSALSRILRKQKQGQDPEYQKYLELKAKFGE